MRQLDRLEDNPLVFYSNSGRSEEEEWGGPLPVVLKQLQTEMKDTSSVVKGPLKNICKMRRLPRMSKGEVRPVSPCGGDMARTVAGRETIPIFLIPQPYCNDGLN